MEEVEKRLRKAINLIVDAGYQLDVNALAFLRTQVQHAEFEGNLKKAIGALAEMPEKPLFLTKEFFEAKMAKTSENLESPFQAATEELGRVSKPYAVEVAGKIEILENPTERVGSEGSVEDYLSYFRDRFTKIEKILRERMDVKEAIPIGEALKAPLKSRVKTIGIVTEKRDRKNSMFVQIEDCGSSLMVLVPSTSSRTLLDKTRRLFVDQVVCVDVTRINDDVFIAKDIISPDIPDRRVNMASEQVYAVLTSDLHIGSMKFLRDAFDSFIGWLKGKEGNSHQREVAERVKYVIIAGDVVDGIGVYPNQERELAISDIYEQYMAASKLIAEIPEYVEVVIIPGNHDAAPQALPQPAILKKYAQKIYDLKNVTMLGNPSRIRLHGIDLLLYHGRSLDDIISAAPDVTYLNLKKDIPIAMEYFLKTRHLAPTYGSKTSIAPLPVDNLVISSPPDILHTGHVHVMGYELYRGTLLVNSGTWQEQTEYQEKMGLIPTPGIVPVVDLKSLKVIPIDFLT